MLEHSYFCAVCLFSFYLFFAQNCIWKRFLEKKTEKEIKKKEKKALADPPPLTPRAAQFSNRPIGPAQRPLLRFLSDSLAPLLSLTDSLAPPVSSISFPYF